MAERILDGGTEPQSERNGLPEIMERAIAVGAGGDAVIATGPDGVSFY